MATELNRNFSKEQIQMAKKHMKKMLTISSHIGNANEKNTKIPPHPIRIAIIKNTTKTHVGENVEKKEPTYTSGGNIKWCNHSAKKIGGFLKI
jgi:hypothetical protein